MIPYSSQLENVEYEVSKSRNHHGRGTTYYCEDIMCFDIETTSAWITPDGKIVTYEKGKSTDYWNSLVPLSLCYLWQFSFNDQVYYGRDLKDFRKLLDDIPRNMKCIIYVHNLSYEFHFLDNIFEWDKVFTRTPHKPMKCTIKDYPNIEFRCSYMLTRLSLDSWGKQIGFNKLTGTVDYNVMRTPLTELDESMLNYGERDVLVMYEGLKVYKQRYGHMRNIPLTQTGTVRRVVKDRLTADAGYMKHIKRLIPVDAKEYKMLQDVFAGGYAHANRMYSGDTISSDVYGIIKHKDINSSYPTVMLAYKYPQTPWAYIGREIPDDSEFEDCAFIMRLLFKNIRSTTFNTYIQASKCKATNIKFDNGRVISADSLEIWVTEFDWLTIKNTYEWDSVQSTGTYKSYKSYLSPLFTSYILELYHNKTTLKGVEGYEDLYMQSKQYINSMFGMAVTSIYMADVVYDQEHNIWSMEDITESTLNKYFDGLRYYRDKRYFLSYSMGVYVTAIARYRLWQLIRHCDMDLLYTDTDSIFYIGDYDWSWFDNDITERLRDACKTTGLDFNKTRPVDSKGRIQPLGILGNEPDCIEFRTLGAKKYCERRTDGKLYLTVSGINKGAVDCLNDDINNFRDGFIFDKDHPSVHKSILTYIDDMPRITYPDGYVSDYKRGINMRPNGYEIHITDEYSALLEASKISIHELPEEFINHLRGHFLVD